MTLMPSSSGGALGGGGRNWGDPSGIARYYRTIRSHLRLIVACLILTLAAAVAYVKLTPPTYTAQAQMVVNPAASQDTFLFSLPVLHSSGVPTQDVLTAASLLHTPAIAQATVRALHLHTSATALLAKVSVVPFSQSNIVTVEATSSSPTEAAQIANTYAAQAVAVRTRALHHAIAGIVPSLQTTVARLPAAQQNGAGTLGDQLNQLEQLESAPDPTVAVSSQATLPTSPTSPKTTLSIAAGLLVGLLIGVGAAFGIDALDPRVRREEQLREQFPSVPVLARVPQRPGTVKPGPLTPRDLPAPALEQYRTLRATLTARRAQVPVAYLLTGTSPSEGKTTSALNLAAVLAQSGADVILIEADLRRPTISRALGLQRFASTEQVLSGETHLVAALEDVRIGTTRFRLLAARGHRVEIADRLSPTSASRLVESAKELADVVIIDSPPLTAVIDALPFAQAVDEVVLAVRVGYTRLSKVSEATELLDRQGTHPTGIILIGVRQPTEFGYGYHLTTETPGWQEDADSPAEDFVPLQMGRSRTPRP